MDKRNVSSAKDLKRILERYDTIVLYGAGIWGKRIYDRIREWKLYKNVIFAETQISERNIYLGCDVISAEELATLRGKWIVVVSVGEKLQSEIVNILEEKKVESCILLDNAARRDLQEEYAVYMDSLINDECRTEINNFKSRLSDAECIVLYGAGIWGSMVLQRLYEWKVYKKIVFAVTDISTTPRSVLGVEVVDIKTAKNIESSVVIVTVSADLSRDLCDNLERIGVSNYIQISESLRYALRIGATKYLDVDKNKRKQASDKAHGNISGKASTASDNTVLDRVLAANQKYIIQLLEKQLGLNNDVHFELYFIEVNYKRDFSFGAWPTRLHCCVRAICNGESGWGEICTPIRSGASKENAIKSIEENFSAWKDVSLSRAAFLVENLRGCVPDRVLEAIDMSLIDLEARLSGISAIEHLGLKADAAVPSLYCVLKKNISEATEEAKRLATTHLKIKLFGDNIHDYSLIKAVRQAIGNDVFLVGDVNMGYAPGNEFQEYTSDLDKAMHNLFEAGLNACEDPAYIEWGDLEKLQSRFPSNPIIPDELMRPAYSVVKTIKPVKGHIYNLHPNCMGSVREAVKLSQKLKSGGSGVMIGDSSLVGPACFAWQQIACGVGAEWCEAIEKPIENHDFLDCIEYNPMEVLPDHRRRLKNEKIKGFGLQVDVNQLRKKSIACIAI